MVWQTTLILFMIDFAILFIGLLEISQGHQVYFNSFWHTQAEIVLKLLN